MLSLGEHEQSKRAMRRREGRAGFITAKFFRIRRRSQAFLRGLFCRLERCIRTLGKTDEEVRFPVVPDLGVHGRILHPRVLVNSTPSTTIFHCPPARWGGFVTVKVRPIGPMPARNWSPTKPFNGPSRELVVPALRRR